MLKGLFPPAAILLGGVLWWLAPDGPGGSRELSPSSGRLSGERGDPPGTPKQARSARRTTARTSHELEEEIAAILRADKDEGAQRRAIDVLLPELMRRDIRAAADFAAALESWASAGETINKVLDHWADSDPEAAAAWAAMLHGGRESLQQPLSLIVLKLARTDARLAVKLTEKYGFEDLPEFAGNLVQIWAQTDAAAAALWTDARPDQELRDHLWARIAMAKSESSPHEAANLAVDKISSLPVQEEAVISVLHQWVLRDPGAAAAWVDLFPEGPLRTRAEGELAGARQSP